MNKYIKQIPVINFLKLLILKTCLHPRYIVNKLITMKAINFLFLNFQVKILHDNPGL